MTLRRAQERKTRKMPLKTWVVAAQGRIHTHVDLGLKDRSAFWKRRICKEICNLSMRAEWKLGHGSRKLLLLPYVNIKVDKLVKPLGITLMTSQ